MTKLSQAAVRKELADSRDAITAATGTAPKLWRPPYGATNAILQNWIKAEFGYPTIMWSVDPLDWKGKGVLVMIFQDIHAFSDSLDLCKFSAFAEGVDEYAQQYSAMVGIPFTGEDVLKTGERIYNLERHYNNLAGHGEGSDTLPARFTDEPSDRPGSDGHVCELAEMLDEYYEKRGWVAGVVPESKLKELEIV